MTLRKLLNLSEAAYLYVSSVTSDSATPGAVAHQARLSMGFSCQEYWNGLPFPPPGDLSDPGIEPMSPVSPELAGGFFTTEPWGSSFMGIKCS